MYSLRQVFQPVADVDRAVGFYRDVLGLSLIARFGDLAFFDLGGTRLMLERTEPFRPGAVLYLGVTDITAAWQELCGRGVAFDDEPHTIFTDEAGTFGPAGEDERMCFFKDPDGNLLALSARVR
jgi:catechol 2,3-dioxygenase-like lactoylglutathione lyase family enzyme